MIKALMIDVDGVLVTGRPLDGRRWDAELEADLGLSPSALAEGFFAPYWDAIVLGKADLSSCLSAALCKIAPALSAADVIDYWFSQDARLDATLIGDLSAHRADGVRIYLATNQEHLRARHLMDVIGLAEHVDGIFYSANLRCRKPELAFFEKVARKAGAHPSQLVLVDDQTTNVDAARSAGWHAVHWNARQNLETALHPIRSKLDRVAREKGVDPQSVFESPESNGTNEASR